jgi:hypothetical protein
VKANQTGFENQEESFFVKEFAENARLKIDRKSI